MGHTIAALVAKARSGDLNAFEALMVHFRPPFGRYAWQMLGSREEAEEVVQDTFLRAYRGLASCREPERFGAWAFSILVNRCRSRRRILSRRNRFRADDHDGVESLSVPSREEDHELRETIERALALLPAEQREAFLLKHVEGLSYGEIAEITGTRIPALKMRVLRACETLRISLRGELHA
jgi:RNA polymerase sigma-70 factor (ECF subfamily)